MRHAIFWLALSFSLSACGLLPPNSLVDHSGYYVRGNRVYYLNAFPGSAIIMNEADVQTFQILDEIFARDKSRVYFDGVPIPNADAPSFQLLTVSFFAKDKNHVYEADKIFSDDPAHFEFLNDRFNLSRDSQAVYWGKKIISTDPTHFVIIAIDNNSIFTKDQKTVQLNGNPIPDANPQTFKHLQDVYARDDQHIFHLYKTIADADIDTFTIIEPEYSRDARHVFFGERTIANADPKSFRVLNAKQRCAADQQHAYFEDRIIPNVDPSTIPTNRTVDSCNANGIFFSGN